MSLEYTPTGQRILAALKDIDVMSWFYLTTNNFEMFINSSNAKRPNVSWVIDNADISRDISWSMKRVVVPFDVYRSGDGCTEAALWVSERVKNHLEEKDQ